MSLLPSMCSFTMPFHILKTMVLAADDCDGFRPEIQGVHVECTPGKPMRLISTDARILVVHDTRQSHTATVPTRFTIPADAINVVQIQCAMVVWNEATQRGELCHEPVGVSFAASTRPFPDWSKVIPSSAPTRFPENVMLNYEYLSIALKVAEKLVTASNPQLTATQKAPGTPLVLKGVSLTIVIMPMKEAAGV